MSEHIVNGEQKRVLNRIEQTLLNLDKIACVNFIVIVRLEGSFSPEKAKETLRILQKKKHFLLNVYINMDSEPAFVYNGQLEIPFVAIKTEEPEAWKRLSEAELSKRFDVLTGPFLRVTHINSTNFTELIFCFHHLYADGMSGVNFARDFIEVYNGEEPAPLPASSVNKKNNYLDTSNFPSSVFGLPGFLKKIYVVSSMISKKLRPVKGSIPSDNQRVPVESRKSYIIHRELSENKTTEILAACRRNAVTVQGVLCSALVKVFMEAISKKGKVSSPRVNCISVVNMRPYFVDKPDNGELGLFVGQTEFAVNMREKYHFFKLAAEIAKDIRKYARKSYLFVIYRLLFSRKFTNPDDFLKVFEVRDPYIEVSNLGKIDTPPQKGKLVLDNIHFASSQHFFQATKWGLNLFVLTYGKKMIFNFQMLSDGWTRMESEKIVDECLAFLSDNCQ